MADRQAIDDVDRGANDLDWQPAWDAARQIAFAEDAGSNGTCNSTSAFTSRRLATNVPVI